MTVFIEYMPLFMFATMAVLLFSGFPVAFVLGGVGIAFGLLGIATGALIPIQLYTITQRMWTGAAENLTLTTVPLFVFMGLILEKTGVAKDMLESLNRLMRRVPGGLALSVTLLGIILAAATGIVGASVVMLTLLALPVMLQKNYSIPLATGTIVSSGTLGILIPPSIMLVIIGDLLSRSVGTMFMAAFGPGIMLGVMYMGYILIYALISPKAAPRFSEPDEHSGWAHLVVSLIVGLVPAFLLIFFVLGSITLGWATPTESAGIGAAGALLLAIFVRPAMYTVLSFTRFAIPGAAANTAGGGLLRRFAAENRGWWALTVSATRSSALTTGMIFMIILAATAFSLTFRLLGGDHLVTDIVTGMNLSPWHLLIAVLILVFILGFFFDWIEITLIVLPVFAPIILKLDFGGHIAQDDLAYWFAILLAVNLQTSFLTPPMGPSLFYLKTVAPPEVRLVDIYKGIIPFVIIQLLAMILVMVFPEIAMWIPHVMEG